MGAWGIKALERDEGLDVLDILKNEYVPEHPVMDLGEMIELMKEEVMLGSDFSQIDFLFDNTAMALAELYFQWKDTRGALDDLSDKGVIKKFPPCIASTHTALVLKEPKTKTSIRRVYLPKTVAYMLVERKKEIDELMELFGDEYIDNNLVFCSSNGRPMESQVINRAFNKLIKENGLPHVVFHSLRHSSITYKLKLNGGDMKSVQGDSGHAQVKMVADVYSHIIDEDRCINAQRLEEAFYSSKTPDPVEDTEPKTADTAVTESDESDAAKILELLKNPETAALLKQLAKAL